MFNPEHTDDQEHRAACKVEENELDRQLENDEITLDKYKQQLTELWRRKNWFI